MSDSNVLLHAHGMHCHGCEHIIESGVGKLAGVRSVKADYPTETVTVAYDPASTDLGTIRATIESAGYQTFEQDDPKRRRGALAKIAGAAIGLLGIVFIIFLDTRWISKTGEPDITQHMSLDLIFVLGLLTGFHCVGMCGAFVLSYTANDASVGRSSYLSHALYGVGKTLSYTLIGAGFGLLGGFVAFTPLLRGVAGALAGAFLIVFGLNMLGLFSPLRRFRLGLPRPLQNFVFAEEARSQHRPFIIGLLNGLMIACGPLQAMYVMAAGTGSALEGAKMLFSFAVGTLPVMLSFGVLATLISSSVTHRLLRLSGVIVVLLGAVMINRGLILTGVGYDLNSVISVLNRGGVAESARSPEAVSAAPAVAAGPTYQTIEMEVNESGYTPSHFVLIQGVPVKWIIKGKAITSCNRRLVVPGLGLEFDVKPGTQIIEFSPKNSGPIRWSCWMGMKRGDFEIVERAPAPPLEASATASAPKEASVAKPEPRATQHMAPRTAQLARYTVVRGDSLKSIALKLYGDSARMRDIAAANAGADLRRLRPGQVIKLPATTPGEPRNSR